MRRDDAQRALERLVTDDDPLIAQALGRDGWAALKFAALALRSVPVLTVGRIVHFYERDDGPVAAIVTCVDEQGAELALFPPASAGGRMIGARALVALDPGVRRLGTTGGSWQWPPRAG